MKCHKYYAEKYKQMFMNMAVEALEASVATRKKVGCIIYTPSHITSFGWNGKPSGSASEICEDENDVTYDDVVHSENNAIKKAMDCGIDLQGSVLFCTLQPCLSCATLIEMVGIHKVYYLEEYRCSKGIDYLTKHNIEVEKIER